uniref:ATP synthase F0 subunit 8 n=1 Tax=Neoepisesarma lafondi TaxID=373427 RepID=UPI001E7B98CB|nr:ATP synthase F0 subunit 8 [Episesarma lafondii]QJH91608.1 ATP synthase F0 subunit 8 [Episesarma lafondii]
MPQMAPLYWLYLFVFFLLIFLLFFMLTYFIKPFNNMSPITLDKKSFSKSWKL